MQISSINSTSFAKRARKERVQLSDEQRAIQKQGFRRGVAATTATIVGVGAAASGGYAIYQDMYAPSAIVIPYEQGVTDTEAIENVLNVDGQLFDYSTEGEVSIPVKYDYLQEKIEQKRDEMRNPFAVEEQTRNNFQEIQKLLEKQEYQKTIALPYTTGDGFVYYNIISQDGISVEEFKKVFDIKEGALSAYPENNISEDWTVGEYYIGSEDKTIPTGTTLKVDESDVHSDNISYDYK